ncbi:hypoxanthine phosphoribosyltransferase [Angomonas deanei]|uniref:Hypoxanthine phosphoribosyltransferase n=1 Tax=Angomonas deanei TaxID=59799 RepID=A0A7G2CR64_9TRYP|nr:hypoxanthine phosphoribosyltransferase [Angomonas deanei]CAD2220993.1 Phosphoribosyl transferase domain containing protein, putative [Angomonas deanei]|eukprot:EPY42014.1 hypoxanthine phosphoribosyltransferase [Angomonas deanei]
MSDNKYNTIAEASLLSETEIKQKMKILAKQIADDYRKENLLDADAPNALSYLKNPLILICVLKGAFMFAADLCRALCDEKVPLKLEFLCVSSYKNDVKTSGEVQLLLDVRHTIEGKHVLLVEDLMDSAVTLHYLQKLLLNRRPATLKTVILLDKPKQKRLKQNVKVDYCLAKVGNAFVVGYGLDYAQGFRELREVIVIDPAVVTEHQYYLKQKAVEEEEEKKNKKVTRSHQS